MLKEDAEDAEDAQDVTQGGFKYFADALNQAKRKRSASKRHLLALDTEQSKSCDPAENPRAGDHILKGLELLEEMDKELKRSTDGRNSFYWCFKRESGDSVYPLLFSDMDQERQKNLTSTTMKQNLKAKLKAPWKRW